jgi:hypothetical protein
VQLFEFSFSLNTSETIPKDVRHHHSAGTLCAPGMFQNVPLTETPGKWRANGWKRLATPGKTQTDSLRNKTVFAKKWFQEDRVA